MTLDRHRLGVEVSERLEAIGTRGGVTPGLWALGPIVRGVFWECTAVPDIRRQAAEVADIVADSAPCSRRGPATFGPPAWRALEATARRLAPVR